MFKSSARVPFSLADTEAATGAFTAGGTTTGDGTRSHDGEGGEPEDEKIQINDVALACNARLVSSGSRVAGVRSSVGACGAVMGAASVEGGSLPLARHGDECASGFKRGGAALGVVDARDGEQRPTMAVRLRGRKKGFFASSPSLWMDSRIV